MRSNSTSALLIIAVTPAPEHPHNLRYLLDNQTMERLFAHHDVYPCGDIKVLNMITGTMLNGACPCPLCVWPGGSGLDVPDSQLRTMDSMRADYASLEKMKVASGLSEKELAKYFNSQEGPPIVSYHVDFPTRMLPPSVHIRMGITTKIYDDIVTYMTPEQFTEHQAAMKRFGIRRGDYHGGSFEGSHAAKVLRHYRQLKLCPTEEFRAHFDALAAFAVVDKSCLGLFRRDGFEDDIKRFHNAYRRCGSSTTTKVHLVVKHLGFLARYQNPKWGLGHFSEQALESSHNKFKKVWKNWKFCEDTRGYEERVRGAVMDFNMQRFTTKYFEMKAAGAFSNNA